MCVDCRGLKLCQNIEGMRLLRCTVFEPFLAAELCKLHRQYVIAYLIHILIFQNFEAWNNLANSYIKQGQKPRAWKVLQEAVKCDYDNWKVWDNIMVVSTDCAHFEEVIRAYHRYRQISI